MKKIEEARKEVVAAKERLERALTRLEAIKEEAETVTLQLAYFTKTIPQTDLFEVEEGSLIVKESDGSFFGGVATRVRGSLAGKAFTLNEEYDWELGKDEEDMLCLVPIKKES